MYLEHRMSTFHASPDCALWYGSSEMQGDLTEFRELAADTQERTAREWRLPKSLVLPHLEGKGLLRPTDPTTTVVR